MNKIIIAILFIIIGSCKMKNKTDEIKQKIIGEWFFTEEEIIPNSNVPLSPPPFQDSYGYTFGDSDNVEVKSGYFYDLNIPEKETDFKRMGQFLGSFTKYKIGLDSSLNIYSLSDSSWHRKRIISISDDTLKLKGEFTYVEKYAKFNQKLFSELKFDKISLKSTGCYGPCPIMKINIYSNGTVQFFGERYTLKKGYFISKISPEKYIALANNFRKINLSTLHNDFAIDASDDNTIIINFWQGDKLVKVVRDYGRVSPSPFICAYAQLEALYQQLELIKIDEKIGKKLFNTQYPPLNNNKTK